MADAYQRLCFRLPAAGEDLLVADLWELGTLGVETESAGDHTIRALAYFPAGWRPGTLPKRMPAWRDRGIELLAVEELPEIDWLAEYRRLACPFALATRFWADPGDPDDPGARSAPPPGRTLLRLPARRAFGTGSHPSTRLVVALLEERPPEGLDLLDVGTGTGVLALVARALGARRVVAVESDLVATIQAGQIADLNHTRLDLVAGTTAALGAAEFDQLLINMTLGSLRRAIPDLTRLLRPGGSVLLSGLLGEQQEELCDLVRSAGLTPGPMRGEDGWIALPATA